MSFWPRDGVVVDPENPEAVAYCDRCGGPHNISDLQYEYRWAGPRLNNTQLLVCDECLNIPSVFEKTRVLPPDPVPLRTARPFYRDAAMTDYRITEAGAIRTTETDQSRVID